MKKNLGVVPAVYPMPVLMVAAYDEAGTVNVMNAAWGMICAMDKIALFIDEDHKTTQNLLKAKAFTVSIADREHMDAADFFGIATGNKMPDKFARTGYHAAKSTFVNAPVIEGRGQQRQLLLHRGQDRERGRRGEGPGPQRQGEPRQTQRPHLRPIPERLLRDRRAGRPGLARGRGVDEEVILYVLFLFMRRGKRTKKEKQGRAL